MAKKLPRLHVYMDGVSLQYMCVLAICYRVYYDLRDLSVCLLCVQVINNKQKANNKYKTTNMAMLNPKPLSSQGSRFAYFSL